ncbi:hypothetical protein SAICODRAFT_29959 [Saitoella complicata NRRL Y-17804]|uniref:uncharacterized protein n=1 Tax=Saitoella complicata (strain BCRC 22490 / CBS 7301 / JCM 7358 / NBRC 10748 / NRRL Y-17804) TaxID=698492 RepID=UPI000866F0AA|nr:uncharacterized protein SAICODRAFT_29959 [Saitoella complicata NRRL Y-17804]ODQ53565.1 hypothetical protein SAICODRAFT_29959 [Saitoella complicata NRRL Y-17804]
MFRKLTRKLGSKSSQSSGGVSGDGGNVVIVERNHGQKQATGAAPPAYSAYSGGGGQSVQQPALPDDFEPDSISQTAPLSPHRHKGMQDTHNPEAGATTNGEEDPYTFLRTFDTAFLIDDSGSMAGSRWRQTALALQQVVTKVVHYDDDGIDIYFLNSREVARGVRSVREVEGVFGRVRPGGATPTGLRLDQILRGYVRRVEESGGDCKPLNLIVITDGVPTDDPLSTLLALAAQLDRIGAPLSQLGIQFLQIGNDEGAREALEELDDGMAGRGVRDMVDMTPCPREGLTGEGVLKCLMGGVNRRIDKIRNA